jgi:hypothetical protein
VTYSATPTNSNFIPAAGPGYYSYILNGVISNLGGPTTPVNVGLISNGTYIWGPHDVYTDIALENIPNPYPNQPVSVAASGAGTICYSANYQNQYIHP